MDASTRSGSRETYEANDCTGEEQRSLVSKNGVDYQRDHSAIRSITKTPCIQQSHKHDECDMGSNRQSESAVKIEGSDVRPVAQKAFEHRPQLESKASELESIEAAVVAKCGFARFKRTKHALYVNAGKGQRWQIHKKKSGQLLIQHGDGVASVATAEQIIEQINPVNRFKQGEVSAPALEAMRHTQGMKCAISGRELTPQNVELDHIKPRADAGTHEIDNVHLVVAEVNRAKGTLGLEAFIQLCNDVAATHPRVPRIGGSFQGSV